MASDNNENCIYAVFYKDRNQDEDKTRLSHIYSNIESARKEYERIIRLGVNAWIYTYPVMD